MPLTNAEKQKAHRQRQREKIARMEKALNKIVYGPWPADLCTPDRQAQFDDAVARVALGMPANPSYAAFPLGFVE